MTAIKADDSARNEPMPGAAQDVAFHADEIDLWDYFWVVWKHRYLVLAGSLIIGLMLFFSPRNYKLTYTYSNWELGNKNFELFLNEFYRREYLDRIIRRLKNEVLRNMPGLFRNLQRADKFRGCCY